MTPCKNWLYYFLYTGLACNCVITDVTCLQVIADGYEHHDFGKLAKQFDIHTKEWTYHLWFIVKSRLLPYTNCLRSYLFSIFTFNPLWIRGIDVKMFFFEFLGKHWRYLLNYLIYHMIWVFYTTENRRISLVIYYLLLT